MTDVTQLQRDFPILNRQIHGHRLVYLDSAATTHKPRAVVEAITDFYYQHNANIHRGVHTLSEEATALYEGARDDVRRFIGAASREEIVFVRNATEGLNLIARSWAAANLRAGDRVVVTAMEHHANLLPWQLAAKDVGASLEVVGIDDQGALREGGPDGWRTLLSRPVKLLALPHVSNVLGTINPVREMTALAHESGTVVVLDGSQSVPHMPVNVTDLGVDFLAFSGHKMLAPTGIGVVYGRRDLLAHMEPFLRGGEMIREVTYQGATWHDLPWKFEAGTPDIAGAIGLGAAVRYLEAIGMDVIAGQEQGLTTYALDKLSAIDGLTIYGPTEPARRGGLASFALEGVHPHDLATLLDGEGIAIRSGHHCAQPLTKRLNVPVTSRASWYLYNDEQDIDALIAGIHKAVSKVRGST